jgi:Holliday junction resolvase RusA-like endonuclease
MNNFVFKKQPKSYNRKFKSELSRTNYINELENSIKQFNSITSPLADDLYGLIYYFHKKNTGTDADNISKLMWDCLKGILFNDDNQVKLRIAGIIDISKGDYSIIDFSNLGGEITAELLDSFDKKDHTVYVECGLLNNSMYKFNLETNGN